MAINKPKRPTVPMHAEGIGDVLVRGLLISEREPLLAKQKAEGKRMEFVIDVLSMCVLDPETNELAMSREEWDEAAAANFSIVLPLFREALNLSGLDEKSKDPKG